MNKTKIISTLGPNSKDYNCIRNMIITGVDVIRINMAYASFDFAKEAIINVRRVDIEEGITTGIMLDTIGPEIKIGGLEKANVNLIKDKLVRIVDSEILGNEEMIPVPIKDIITHSNVDDDIFINNTSVRLKVVKKDDDNLICKVINGGQISSYSTIYTPSIDFNTKFLSNKDREIIEFAIEMQVDYIALSNVKEEMDILDVNDLLISLNDNNIQLISKIENKHALDQIDRILKVSDGIIISRGDLAIDLNVEKVPSIQKDLINKAKENQKIVVISTDLLSSMKDSITPSRAEVSDVANSVLDSVDALILGEETAVGNYPVETVKMMNDIIEEVENSIDYNDLLHDITKDEVINISKAIAYSSVDSANRVKASAIICSTLSGATAKDISNYRPSCPVIAISPNSKVVRGLSINYGIVPLTVGMAETTDELVTLSLQAVKKILDIKAGEKVVIAGSFPLESVNYTNFMKIEEIK